MKILKPVNWFFDQNIIKNSFDQMINFGYYPFENMWYPVHIPTYNGDSSMVQVSYYNAGVSSVEISDIYHTKYGTNFIVPRVDFDHYGEYDRDQTTSDLAYRIKAVLMENIRKYQKLIELNGFDYNPLFNVDGTELYSILQNQGDTIVSNNPNGGIVNVVGDDCTITYTYDGAGNVVSSTITSTLDNTTEHYVNADDANDVDDQRLQSKDVAPSVQATRYDGYINNTSQIHNNAKNDGNKDYNVDAKDNAFGEALKGGDYFRTEKKVRQGNIGVTKTQELIESERNVLRFNIIDEFFKDLNEQILVGLYDLS